MSPSPSSSDPCLRRRAAGVWPFAFVVLAAAPLAAQKGDVRGEVQPELPAEHALPPPPPLSPADELATIRVQPGFRLELVAAEPTVQDPVCAVADADGSLWVVEMRSYMRTVDATDEQAPDGRVVVLRDRDGDGRYEDMHVFLDGLVLPRAVLPLRGGALVIAPPQLLWCEDRDGDGRADATREIAKGFQSGLQNPEHSGNGLLWGLDNRIHLANDRRMFRWQPTGDFAVEASGGGGQWGLSQDDRGRLFYNYNEDWLRCDLVPGRFRGRVLDQGSFAGANHRVVPDTSIFPSHKTPGVNRGYQPGMLQDGVLTRHTAACSPFIARGTAMGDARGDALVCDPSGNVVRRLRFAQPDGLLSAANPYPRAEFLASTDERFRPVHLFALPDGSVGLVDLYRGVIQHRNFVTSFLRKQIVDRKLEQPIGRGRIWRIAAADARVAARPLDRATAAELVAALADADGWRRDQAQRLLVQRQERTVGAALRDLVRTAPLAAARMHAAAALDGLDLLDSNDLRVLLQHDDPAVVAFALTLCDARLAAGDGGLWAQAELLAQHPAPTVRWHLALAIGAAEGRQQARAFALGAQLAAGLAAGDAVLRDALVALGHDREPAWLQALAAARGVGTAASGLFAQLARECGRERQAAGIERRLALLAVAAACREPWQQRALLQGLLAALPEDPQQRVGYYVFPRTPEALAALAQSADAEVRAAAQKLLAAAAIQADALAAHTTIDDADLPAETRALVAKGAGVFAAVCAACHQPDGRGMAGLAPPLRGSAWVTGDERRLARIVLFGLRGPVDAAGQRFDGEMPGQGYLADADLAAVLTFLRRSFGHQVGPVDAATVTAVRAQHQGRTEPFTVESLQQVR